MASGGKAVLHACADDDPLENPPLAEQRDGAVTSALSLPAPVPPVAGEQGHGRVARRTGGPGVRREMTVGS